MMHPVVSGETPSISRFGVIGIGHKTSIKPARTAAISGDRLGHTAAGTGFCRNQRQAVRLKRNRLLVRQQPPGILTDCNCGTRSFLCLLHYL